MRRFLLIVAVLLLLGSLVQSQNVSSPTPMQDRATGATGSAVPGYAVYIGGNGSGNLTGSIACDKSAFANPTTSGNTQLVALVSGQSIYVCSYALVSPGTVNVKFTQGTGTACGTGTSDASATDAWTAQTGISRGSGLGMLFKTNAGNALCVNLSATASSPGVGVDVTYTQF